MNGSTVIKWNQVLARVHELSDRFRSDGSTAWFRGHRDSTWKLESTLHRYVGKITEHLAQQMPANELRKLLHGEYKTIFRRFKTDAWSLLNVAERSPWGIVFAMQHFGLPTRLLDWTESFTCALFFAQHKRKRGEAAAVWVLDPQCLNMVSVRVDGLVAADDDMSPNTFSTHDWNPFYEAPDRALRSIAIAPLYTNPRMVAQRSGFTIAGDSMLPLEREFRGWLVKRERLVKIELPSDTYDDVETHLDAAGVNAFNFYPDLEGIAMKHESLTVRKIEDARKWYPHFFK